MILPHRSLGPSPLPVPASSGPVGGAPAVFGPADHTGAGPQAAVGPSIAATLGAMLSAVAHAIEHLITRLLNRPVAAPQPAAPSTAPADTSRTAQQYGLTDTPANVAAFQQALQRVSGEPGVLGPGASAPQAVTELQQLLSSWGYNVPATGQFDPPTAEAVLAWKTKAGLAESFQLANGQPGVLPFVDARTRDAMLKALQPAPTPAPTTEVPPTEVPPTDAPAAPAAPAGPLGVPGNWTPIFDDEFDQPEQWGKVWSQMRADHWEMNNVRTNPENVSVADGVASLKLANAKEGAYMSTDPTEGGGGFKMGYGYAEARIKLPTANGQLVGWPAWWICGDQWPSHGEADIFEGLGGEATSNYHSDQGADNSNRIDGDWGGEWHTFGIDRAPGENRIYWDGKLVRTYKTYDGGAPEALILNIGSGGGPQVDGATMQVDYVRVWQRAE